MIVVDTNVIAYLFIPGPFTTQAERAASKDSWCAPTLWRSEFRNVLTQMIRRKDLKMEEALRYAEKADALFWGREFRVQSGRVFKCIAESKRSAYDCEFVALAMDLGLQLVSTDEPLISEFPKIAVHLRDYVKQGDRP